ncbi:MAG: diguanylate cyclase [Sulfurimonas sp. RIFOXYD12_FULL_36_11]|jgi:diguanylate cyclase (GGDEF)-like protein/PAS domain S-box-containing protein|uniref:diguanylate cyclase domain-containing protein n=1 Tax=Sulfurimonas sp. RIFOXYB12_FULL_35_9 TaxID=1802256 RepID=UPI0008C03B05|nr:diguanylate cyclase [Sulfurimonas sp. RIFOXYB12_FULL_35_9]OHE03662.1 MAG: diguanylate cyclase [Sulfurimonas sp. RIFOXYB12_FULL_35_9]OHE18929.1 MAG: diguanylate cyclase [Sulfurimonas sp. RIFOXYD2_FULL_37_8]OHE19435.1 MAG: diguanylate cyclase [Sulfurimonas sp. RIFOXYD12_FULL_36_11]
MEIKYPDVLLDSLENGHMIIDDKFIVSYWNRWLAINTQISKEEIIGKKLDEFYPNINYKVLYRKIKTALLINTPSFYDTNSNVKFIPMNRNKVTTSSLMLMQQQVTISPYIACENKVMVSIYDISELFEAKLSLKKEIEKVNKLNDKLEADQEIIDRNIMMMRTSFDGVIIDVSTFFCQFFEFKKDFILGKNISTFKQDGGFSATYKELWETIRNKKCWSGELKLKTYKGEEKWVQSRITPILDIDGEVLEFSAVYHDITNEKLLEELYITDPLTKLYNRAHFDEVVNFIVKHQRKTDTDFVLVITDIDHFKSINDTYGHQIGDEALVSVANTLKDSLREDDLIARWGGEEFVIMLKNVTLDEAKTIIEKVRASVEKNKINGTINATASFGITKYILGEDIKKTFKRVDDALYEAKKSGRNRAVLK